MMKFLILLSILLPFQFATAGGVHVGNGGNVVRCQGETSFQSLEYVMTKNMYGYQITPVPAHSLTDSLTRIGTLIEAKLPQFSLAFNEYVAQYKNTERHKTYVWNAKPIDVVYDGIIWLPYWCNNSHGTAEIVQAVVRTTRPNAKEETLVNFDYDFKVLAELEKSSSVQMSFLVVHEWIWNLTNDRIKNRELDFFLHSPLLETMTAEEANDELVRLGF